MAPTFCHIRDRRTCTVESWGGEPPYQRGNPVASHQNQPYNENNARGQRSGVKPHEGVVGAWGSRKVTPNLRVKSLRILPYDFSPEAPL